MILAGLMGALSAAGGGTPTVTWGSIAYSAVNEGQQNTVNLNLANWDNTDIWWYLVDAGGTPINNITQISPNAGTVYGPGTGNFSLSINFTFNNDATADGELTYYVRIENVGGDLLIPRQGPFTCNDTSFPLGQYIFNGTPTNWATTNITSPTYGAYTYPDETTGSLNTLTGTQFVLSGQLGKSRTVNINLWFYPTANNKMILGEVGQAFENTGWHYSMLEINSTNYLKGRLWEMASGPYLTSTGTVTLNAWNHVYLYFNNTNNTFGMSLNNETAVTRNDFIRHVPDPDYAAAYYGIGMTDNQNMENTGNIARYQGKFDTPVIDTTLTGSNYTSTKAKYLPPLSLAFGGDASPDYLSVPASADWALGTSWTIEWWSKATTRTIDGGAGLWTVMCQNPGSGIDIYYQDSKLKINNGTVLATEPVPGQWTHVALVNNAGTITLYYNGVSVYSGGNWNLGNTTDPLVIGRRGSGNYQYFPGFLSLIRISNTARYLTGFNPTITYGNDTVPAGSKLDIETGSAYGDTAVSIASDPTLATTYPAGSTITFQDGDIRTITAYDNYPGGTDIFWDTSKTGTLFPITLKTANYSAGDTNTKLFLGLDTPLTDTSASARTITNNSVTTTANVPSTVSPASLEFNNPQQDYLVAPASTDWNLGNNWTIEFWIRSNNNSASNINIPGGQWALLNQGGWYGAMPDDNCILVGMTGGYLTINQSASGDISFAEPTTQQWTHVAIVNNGGGSAQKVYYNGVEQTALGANYTSNGKTNTTEPLYIGRLKPGSGGYFDGKMAMIRISNTAKYLTAFTATATYGIEGDTKLFLGKYAPWTDNTGLRAVANINVSTATSFPQSFTGHLNPYNGGQLGATYSIFGDPNITTFAAIPVGARITSNLAGFGTRLVTSNTSIPAGQMITYDNTGLPGGTPSTTSDTYNFYW